MKKILCYISLVLVTVPAFAQLKTVKLLTESKINPLGIDAPNPSFSWQLSGGMQNLLQTAYQLQVFNRGKLYWDSGKAGSAQSVFISYAGPALRSGELYTWQVRVWDNQNHVSPYSTTASFRMGLLRASDWKAKWIEADYADDGAVHRCPVFRKSIHTGKKIASAVVFVSSHGLYDLQINGQRVGDAVLSPGWTSYHKRQQYQCYEVTGLLSEGQNSLRATLGSGWYRTPLYTNPNNWGTNVALLLQMMLTYTDGTTETIVSDKSWEAATGPVISSEIYNGEVIDARKDAVDWRPVRALDLSMANLIATESEAVKKHEIFKPLKIWVSAGHDTLVDFGQNMAGWVKARLKGNAGDTVKLEFGEVLDQQGNLYRENLKTALMTDRFILKGKGEETFEPHFTYHGFRYARVKGLRYLPKTDELEAISLYSDMPHTGSFECSDASVNRLQQNIVWGQRSNYVAIPTDNPQRDERLGWTADAQLFGSTASFNYNTHNFLGKWYKDLAADQAADGSVSCIMPAMGAFAEPMAGWSDAAAIVPWTLYRQFGDVHKLSTQYPSLKKWVDYIRSQSKDDLWKGDSFGDWLATDGSGGFMGKAGITDVKYIAQVYYACSTQLLINAAKVLGNEKDVADYTALLRHIKKAFNYTYLDDNSQPISDCQTARVLALEFDLLPEAKRAAVAAALAADIRKHDDHLTVGMLGAAYINRVLTRYGYNALAYRLLMQDSFPSWLYQVKKGATTIWERWDGIKPDGSFNNPEMNSFNNYALGAVGDWLYQDVAGIQTDTAAAGYKKIIIKPHIGNGLTYVKASLETYYGRVSMYWRVAAGKLTMEVEIPANTTAEVFVPSGPKGDYRNIKVGSGKYHYESVL